MHARRLVALTAALISAAAIAEGNSSASHALVEVRLKRIDAVAVLPGADFRPYMKVILDPAYAAFREDVVREVEPTAKQGPSGRDTGNEVEEILGAVRSSFDRAFKDTYQKAGLEVVTSPGPDVLRLSTAVIDLCLAAPTSVIDGGRLSWTANAGKATLILQARDSNTSAMLWAVQDTREMNASPSASSRLLQGRGYDSHLYQAEAEAVTGCAAMPS